MSIALLLSSLVLSIATFFWPRSPVIRWEDGVPKNLLQNWQQQLPNVEWVHSGPCDLRIVVSSGAPGSPPAHAIDPGTLDLPVNLGEFRSEFSDPASGALAVAATPIVFSHDGKTYAEKWGVLETLSLKEPSKFERTPWAELTTGKPWILALDRREMKRVWIGTCTPHANLSPHALRTARWFYRVQAQNAVIAARYYSPWTKMVDPPGMRPWKELVLIPQL